MEPQFTKTCIQDKSIIQECIENQCMYTIYSNNKDVDLLYIVRWQLHIFSYPWIFPGVLPSKTTSQSDLLHFIQSINDILPASIRFHPQPLVKGLLFLSISIVLGISFYAFELLDEQLPVNEGLKILQQISQHRF